MITLIVLACIIVHLFTAVVVTTLTIHFDWFSCGDKSDTMGTRVAVGFFWEITMPVALLIISFLFIFTELPYYLIKKGKEAAENIKKKKALKKSVEALKEKAKKEEEEDRLQREQDEEANKALDERLDKALSRDVNGESDDFRAKPKLRKHKGNR